MSTTEKESKSKYRQNAEDIVKKYDEERMATAEQDIAEVNTQIDDQIAKAESDVAQKKVQLGEDYRTVLDTVAVQREIDKKQIAETMANMGLSRSGLSATQQTAVQLSSGNKVAAADRQRQAAVDSLVASLAEYKRESENTRRTSQNSIIASAKSDIADYSQKVYAAADEAEAAEYAAEQERLASEYKAEQERITAVAKAQADATKDNNATLLQLYKDGVISPETYVEASEKGYTPSQALEQEKSAPDQSNPIEPEEEWSWKTAAYRKTGTDTVNGLWGLDRNDTVEYYDENGELKTITLKDLRTNLMNEGMSRKDANAFLNGFNDKSDENTMFFSGVNGGRNYVSTVKSFVKNAFNKLGKDGVLAELEEAYNAGLIDEYQYAELANPYGISNEDLSLFKERGYLEESNNIKALWSTKGEAYKRYEGMK